MKKNTLKLFFAAAFTFIFALSNFNEASANTLVNSCTYDLSSYTLKESDLESNNGSKIYDVIDFEKAAVDNNIPLELDGKEIMGISIYLPESNDVIEDADSLPNFTTFAGPPSIKVTNTGQVCGVELIRSSYFPAGNAKMEINQKVRAQLSANVKVDLSVISAALGFDVSKEYMVTETWSDKVPAGQTWNVVANPTYLSKQYDVYRDGKRTGDGTALKPIGVCFGVIKYKD
ncbi:hypothetical protein MKY88_10150 [Lysinibacillus sp. FSL R7-0073]|uniref:hypothetical protein n=1 Tax=Lysinibacillus sp. FSL R7-0073 TaxID=2921669 RepID=UPI0030F75390